MQRYEFIGVDVAKDKFDVCLEGGQSAVFTSTKKGLNAFYRWIKKHTNNPWVCMESTGHYSELIAEYLIEKEIAQVSIVNPMQIKSFCRAKLLRNKNDIVDAKAIAEYAKIMEPRLFTQRTDANKEINELNKLLETLKKQMVQLKNQLQSTRSSTARKEIKKLIEALKRKIKVIEMEIKSIIKGNDELNQKFELMLSIPGVGDITAFQCIAAIKNIHDFENAKQFAAFSGLTPKQNQSGKFEGRARISKIGSSKLRKALYMASLSAIRFNPAISQFAQNLKAKGKHAKLIICAVMRKMAHLIFGVLKNNQPFNSEFITQKA